MIMEFSLKQISWIVIGALGIGGTGYVSMNNKMDELDKRTAVMQSHMEHQNKMLDRIEEKLNTLQGK